MKNRIWIIAVGILALLGVVSNIYVLSTTNESIVPFLYLFMYAMIAVYLVYDFKTPHGNLLKYVFLVFSFALLIPVILNLINDYKVNFALGFAAVIVSYIGGRLNRKDNNIRLITTVAVCLIIAGAFGFTTEVSSIEFEGEAISYMIALDLFNYLIIWCAVIISYISRFNEHIEAGKQ